MADPGSDYFLLRRQEKVIKEKATPARRPLSGIPCAARRKKRLPKTRSKNEKTRERLRAQTVLRRRAPVPSSIDAFVNAEAIYMDVLARGSRRLFPQTDVPLTSHNRNPFHCCDCSASHEGTTTSASRICERRRHF